VQTLIDLKNEKRLVVDTTGRTVQYPTAFNSLRQFKYTGVVVVKRGEQPNQWIKIYETSPAVAPERNTIVAIHDHKETIIQYFKG